jgi:hypothetical protein
MFLACLNRHVAGMAARQQVARIEPQVGALGNGHLVMRLCATALVQRQPGARLTVLADRMLGNVQRTHLLQIAIIAAFCRCTALLIRPPVAPPMCRAGITRM